MSHELNTSESDGSNVGDTGYVNDSWLTEQDDIREGDNEKLTEETLSTDYKTQEQGKRAPVSKQTKCDVTGD